MVTARIAAAVIAIGVLAVGCGPSAPAGGPTATNATAAASSPAPTATAGEAPMPRHVTFAAGETIRADGQAGIFFLDPKTGAAEGWVVPAFMSPGQGYPVPFAFTPGGVSADGRVFAYACMEPRPNAPPGPCGGGGHDAWYLFDTATGRQTPLPGLRARVTLSPDGKTVLGATAGGVALVDAARPETLRALSLPPGADTSWFNAYWSPDASRLILTGAFGAALVRVSDGRVQDLAGAGYASWAPDGSRFALGRALDEAHSELVVFDREGRRLWSKPMATGGAFGVWSADGTLLYAEEQERPAAALGYGTFDRIVVLDAATGATRYRVPGAFCPIGWIGRSHRFLASTYGFGVALVDLSGRSVRLLDRYVQPTPFDERLAIIFDGSDFYSYDLDAGVTKLIARTTVTPAWDRNHGELFAGDRLVFTALHLGHGGCGEGATPKDPAAPRLLVGPFADDAPATLAPPAQ